MENDVAKLIGSYKRNTCLYDNKDDKHEESNVRVISPWLRALNPLYGGGVLAQRQGALRPTKKDTL